MTNTNDKALAFMAERDEQRTAAHLDALAVADALGAVARRACCLETLAAAVLGEIPPDAPVYRLAELLALDVSALAVEIEAMRDDAEDAAHGTPNRLAARD